MITKKLTYCNGHFYDDETQKRVDLKENIQVTVISETDNFIPVKPAGNKPKHIFDSEKKYAKIKSDKKVKHCRKAFDAGQILFFYIPIRDAWFQAELLEDLYFYLNRTNKNNEGKLYSCACTVTQNTNGKIPYFEQIYAKSLNELYKSTYVHYFGNFGNPACNALDRFFIDANNENSKLKCYRLFSKGDKE